MPISIQCGGCAKKYKAPDNAVGKKVKCEKCGHIIAIPAKGSAKAQTEPIALADEEPQEIVEFLETDTGTYDVEDSPPARRRKPAGGKKRPPKKKVRDDDFWEDDDEPKRRSRQSDDKDTTVMKLIIGLGIVCLLVVPFLYFVFRGLVTGGGPSTTPSTSITPQPNNPPPRVRPAQPPKPVLSPGRGLFHQVQEFSPVEQQFTYLSMSPDGERVIAITHGKNVYIWEQGTNEPKARYDAHQNHPYFAAMLPDGKRALSSTIKEVFIWDIETQRGLVRYEGHRSIMKAAAFTPDGKLVFSSDGLQGIHVWEAGTGKPLGKLEGHKYAVQALAVPADGSQLVSSDGHDVRLWTTNDFRQLKVMPVRERGSYSYSTVAAGGRRALFSDLRSVDVWNLENGEPVIKIEVKPNSGAMAVTADGRRAVIATGKQILVWDVVNGKDVDRFEGDPIAVQRVAISADGKRIASSGYGKTIRLWELKAGQ